MLKTHLPQAQQYVCLGLKPSKPTAQRLKAKDFNLALPTPPPSFKMFDHATYPMYDNDRIGCCAIASPAHLFGLTSKMATGVEKDFTDSEIITAYSACSGYDPETGANDDGCDLETVQEYLKTTGIGGVKIEDDFGLDTSEPNTIVAASHVFGGAHLGIALPSGWQRSANANGVWDAGQGRAGSWGGHAVPLVGWDANYLYVSTWGYIQKMTRAALAQYGMGCYVNASRIWTVSGKTPSGYDLVEFIAAFKEAAGRNPNGFSPPSPPPPPPPLPPGPTPQGLFTGTIRVENGLVLDILP